MTDAISAQQVKALVQQHWNGRAADFDAGPSHGLLNDAQGAAWRRLLRGLTGNAPVDALDIGCGTGFLALLLAAQGHRVVGIDIAPEMLAQARRKALASELAVDFHPGDAESPDMPARSVDLIVERHVIWTLPNPIGALESWQRLLRPGGRLALIEGHWADVPIRGEYELIRDRLPLFGGSPAAELARLVAERGYVDVQVEALMDAALWTEPPAHQRYLVTARAPC